MNNNQVDSLPTVLNILEEYIIMQVISETDYPAIVELIKSKFTQNYKLSDQTLQIQTACLSI